MNHTAVVIASGPSLTDAQCAVVQRATGVRSIVINASYVKAPWADVVYAGDYLFIKTHDTSIRKLCPKAQLWTQDKSAAERYRWRHHKGVNKPGLGLDHIHMNGNSGAQGVNLAYLWGYRRIVLLGFDMKHGPGGQTHWHGDHPKPLVQRILPEEWAHKFTLVANDLHRLGCTVLNATPGSALTCFPTTTVEEEFRC